MLNCICLIMGKSGSGKTTLSNFLHKRFKLKPVESYTTRPKRHEDEKGHIFISEKEFDKLENLVAYTKFDSYQYCATMQQIEECETYVIDPKGVEYFIQKYTGNKHIFIFYLKVPWYKLWFRMLKRGDKPLNVLKRIINDSKMFKDVMKLNPIVLQNSSLSTLSSLVLSRILDYPPTKPYWR